MILIPTLVGNACLMLRSAPAPPALPAGCVGIPQRGFSTFGTGEGFLAGANILQIASIGISAGLLADDEGTIAAGYGHINDEVVVQPQVKVDGIKQDGGFQQHLGVLYNGARRALVCQGRVLSGAQGTTGRLCACACGARWAG